MTRVVENLETKSELVTDTPDQGRYFNKDLNILITFNLFFRSRHNREKICQGNGKNFSKYYKRTR